MGDRSSEYQALLDVRDGVNRSRGIDTIIGGVVHEPPDVRLAALWRHDSVKANWPRQFRASAISEASDAIIRERT